MSDNPYQLRTLSRALDVLTMIETSPEPLTMTAIADRMGEAGPVIFRILRTLEAKGFIRRVADTRSYGPAEAHDRAGLARLLVQVMHGLSGQPPQSVGRMAERLGADAHSVELALKLMRESQLAVVDIDGGWSLSPHLPELARSQSTAEILEAARPVMERLQEKTGETVALFVRNGALQVAVHVLASRQPLRYALEAGSVFPVNRGAAGKASLAWLDEDEVRTIVADRALIDEKIDLPLLLDALRATRRRGYASSLGERITGAAAVSVPVTDRSGEIRCAMVVTGPESRLSPEILHGLGMGLREELIASGLFQEPEAAGAAATEDIQRSETVK